MRLVLAGLMMGLVGCQHTHLRYNTVRQAETLAEIYEQQVLDNLAKTVHDAHALPYFAYPKDGSTRITDEGSFSASPIHDFRSVFGVGGKRTGLEQWGLTPVSDPAKLQLMQCAYQRAVYGQPLSCCVHCCNLEKEFEGLPDLTLQVLDPKTGQALCDPETGENYRIEDRGAGPVYVDESDNTHLIDLHGVATIQQYECNGPCAVTCGWIGYGSRCDVPKDCCSLIGHYCGTYVWVPACHRDKLSRLTLKILDYAVNDAPVFLSREKEVTLKIDRFGELTASDADAVGSVKAVIGIDDPINSLLVIDKCALEADARATLKNQGVIDEGAYIPWLHDWSKGLPHDKDQLIREGLDNDTAEKVQAFERSHPTVSPSKATPFVIPKRRSYRPGDGAVNPYRLQRQLDAIDNR